MNLRNIFKKPVFEKETELEKAKNQGFISEEEFLRLKFKRAEDELDEFLKQQKKIKK